MKMLKPVLLIGMFLFLAGCAYQGSLTEPVVSTVEKLDIVRPIPLEAGLLITEESRNQIFKSPSYADYQGDSPFYKIEPYRLAIGQTFEKAGLDILSQIFQKVHLIRSAQEARNYRLVIEPKLVNFHLHLFYNVFGLHMNNELVDMKCQVKVIGTLISQGKPVWQKTIETPLETKTRVYTFWLQEEVGALAADTMVLALKDLALRMVEESRPRPGLVSGWLEKIKPPSR